MGRYALRVEPERDVAAPLWRALRAASAPASIVELHVASRANPNAIQLRLRRWVRVGFVAETDAEGDRWSIAPSHSGRAAAPTDGTLSQVTWAALRRLARPATTAEILAATGEADRPVYCRLRRWLRQGFVVRDKGEPKKFSLTAEAPDIAAPPKVGEALRIHRRPTARQRLWAAMRVLKRFDVPMLMMTAEVSRRACDDFLQLLARAGYVRLLGHRNVGSKRTWSTYQLVRGTGPKCPSITNPESGERMLIDRNTGQSVALAGSARAAKGGSDGR